MPGVTVDRHAATMDAHHYWRQFPVRVYWDTPKEIVGTVKTLGEQKTKDGYLPVVALVLDDGTVAELLVSQTRLIAELVDKAPAVGDRLKITYTGEAGRAAPGMNPTKEFAVAVKRQGSGPRPGAEKDLGEVPASENGPRAGNKGTS